jgi:hypothetical protein
MIKIKGIKILNFVERLHKPIIFFDHCADVYPIHQFPSKDSPSFNHTKMGIFLGCNLDFLHYWIKPEYFPSLQTIYTDKICDGEIFRFENINVYTTRYYYEKYKNNDLHSTQRNINLKFIDSEHFDTFQLIADNIE